MLNNTNYTVLLRGSKYIAVPADIPNLTNSNYTFEKMESQMSLTQAVAYADYLNNY